MKRLGRRRFMGRLGRRRGSVHRATLGITKVVDHLNDIIILPGRHCASSRGHRSRRFTRTISSPSRRLFPGTVFVALALLLPARGVAQDIPARHGLAGIEVEAAAVAREFGLVASEDVSSLTLRAPAGILTLFQASPDVVWQPRGAVVAEEASLPAPVTRTERSWWLPVDALSFIGLRVVDGKLEGPEGLSRRLAIREAVRPDEGDAGELVDLGRGVPGLRLFVAGPAGPATQSMLLADAGLLALVMPEERVRFDGLVEQAGRDRPLVAIVTAVVDGAWESVVTFSQGQVEAEARHPFRLRLLDGDASVVGPRSPVVGVILLPEGFNLREPITVTWGGASASITFRR
jgi:hypothetical protein